MKQTSYKSEIVKQLAPYIGLGFQFASTIGIGIVLGYLLDLWFQTSPFGMLCCVLFFSVVAMISFFRTVTKNK
jgi:F0F1-type ATP synthase assembly protein I